MRPSGWERQLSSVDPDGPDELGQRAVFLYLVESSAVQQGGQLVQAGLGGVQQVLDAQQVPLWRTEQAEEILTDYTEEGEGAGRGSRLWRGAGLVVVK